MERATLPSSHPAHAAAAGDQVMMDAAQPHRPRAEKPYACGPGTREPRAAARRARHTARTDTPAIEARDAQQPSTHRLRRRPLTG
eukprot:scaffold80166_cov31-Tisochrysis_lutea.AAC.1